MERRLLGSEEAIDAHAGQVAAFRHLADEQLDRSYRLASAILGNRADAEDAVHDAFVTAWRSWGSLRDTALLGPWFTRILVNTCRDRLRRASRTRVGDISAGEPIAVDAFAATHDRQVLDAAFARLRDDDRIVLVLRYYRDLTVDDIARFIGVPRGTVMSRLHRAQGRLREALTTGESPRSPR